MLFYVYFDRIGIIIQIFLFISYNIYNVFARQLCLAKFQNVIVLNELEPKEILMNGDKRNLILYKGVMISKKDAQKEMFKIDLLSRLEDK